MTRHRRSRLLFSGLILMGCQSRPPAYLLTIDAPSGLRSCEIRQEEPTGSTTVDAIDRLTGERNSILEVADLASPGDPSHLRVRWVSDDDLRIELGAGFVTRYRGIALENAPHPVLVKLTQR